MTRRTIIYIPGIGDRRDALNRLQSAFLATWVIYGFSAQLFVMDWQSTESYRGRFDELLSLVTELRAQGREVAIVGASAAASSVLLALMEQPDALLGVVTICGQIDGAALLNRPVSVTNPRFGHSIALLKGSLDAMTPDLRRRVLTLRPWIDGIVPPRQATLSGATNHQMPVVGHMAGIGFGLLFEGYRISRFLKSVQ